MCLVRVRIFYIYTNTRLLALVRACYHTGGCLRSASSLMFHIQVLSPGEWFLPLNVVRTAVFMLVVNVFVWVVLYESLCVYRQLLANRQSEHLSEEEIDRDLKLAKKIRNRGVAMFFLLLAGIASLSSTIRASWTAERWEVEVPSSGTSEAVFTVFANARYCALYTGTET